MRGREWEGIPVVKKKAKASVDQKAEQIRKKRREIVRATRDKARNVKRAAENMEDLCIVCGKRIKKGQPIRIMPKDKKCQEVRVYHLRTCGPGSTNWQAFKANREKSPRKASRWIQLSFNWKEPKR